MAEVRIGRPVVARHLLQGRGHERLGDDPGDEDGDEREPSVDEDVLELPLLGHEDEADGAGDDLDGEQGSDGTVHEQN